jgi:hypothetical protein
MEYNLQKTVEPNLQHYLFSHDTYPHLTAFPGHSLVVPGIGNILSNPTFFVPLHNVKSNHAVEKVVDLSHNQEGSGTDTGSGIETQDNAPQIKSEGEREPELQNDRKRKMNTDILEAFKHPTFKSKTITLNPDKTGSGIGSGIPLKRQKRSVMHNFQFL